MPGAARPAAMALARRRVPPWNRPMMDTYAGYKEGDDLPTLYSHVQKVLKLSPADQTEGSLPGDPRRLYDGGQGAWQRSQPTL
jgi:hypothetical protein